MKIYEMLKEANEKAKKANIEEYELKVRYIFEDLFKEKEVNEKEFFDAINKLCEGYPYQYIDDNVLIPRLDTEILVDSICKYIEENYNINDDIRILEIGIGSRCPYNCNIKKIRKI